MGTLVWYSFVKRLHPLVEQTRLDMSDAQSRGQPSTTIMRDVATLRSSLPVTRPVKEEEHVRPTLPSAPNIVKTKSTTTHNASSSSIPLDRQLRKRKHRESNASTLLSIGSSGKKQRSSTFTSKYWRALKDPSTFDPGCSRLAIEPDDTILFRYHETYLVEGTVSVISLTHAMIRINRSRRPDASYPWGCGVTNFEKSGMEQQFKEITASDAGWQPPEIEQMAQLVILYVSLSDLYKWCVSIYRAHVPQSSSNHCQWTSELNGWVCTRAQLGDEFLIIPQGSFTTKHPNTVFKKPKSSTTTVGHPFCPFPTVVCQVVEIKSDEVRILYPDHPNISDWVPRFSLRFWHRVQSNPVIMSLPPSLVMQVGTFILSSVPTPSPSSSAASSSSSSTSWSDKPGLVIKPELGAKSTAAFPANRPSSILGSAAISTLSSAPCWTVQTDGGTTITQPHAIQFNRIISPAPHPYRRQTTTVRDVPGPVLSAALQSLQTPQRPLLSTLSVAAVGSPNNNLLIDTTPHPPASNASHIIRRSLSSSLA
jgi:hypothetical protein